MVVMVVLSLLVAITVVPGKTAELTSQSQSARLDAGGIQAKEALTRYFILHNVLYAV
jgi:hypothetical protein